MVLLGDEAHVEARLSLFGDSANLTQARCAVFAKHTIGSKVILDVPDRTPRLVGHVESSFGLFGNSVSVSAI
jgi:hypothetical protein